MEFDGGIDRRGGLDQTGCANINRPFGTDFNNNDLAEADTGNVIFSSDYWIDCSVFDLRDFQLLDSRNLVAKYILCQAIGISITTIITINNTLFQPDKTIDDRNWLASGARFFLPQLGCNKNQRLEDYRDVLLVAWL